MGLLTAGVMVVCCADVLGLIDVLDLVAYTTQGFRSGAGPLRWSSLEGKTAGDLLALFPRCYCLVAAAVCPSLTAVWAGRGT